MDMMWNQNTGAAGPSAATRVAAEGALSFGGGMAPPYDTRHALPLARLAVGPIYTIPIYTRPAAARRHQHVTTPVTTVTMIAVRSVGAPYTSTWPRPPCRTT